MALLRNGNKQDVPPPGNQRAVGRGKWKEAISRALARYGAKHGEGGTISAGLDALANKLIEAAANGDPWALQEIGNRFDGKPAQAIIIDGDGEGGPVRIEGAIKLVRPRA